MKCLKIQSLGYNTTDPPKFKGYLSLIITYIFCVFLLYLETSLVKYDGEYIWLLLQAFCIFVLLQYYILYSSHCKSVYFSFSNGRDMHGPWLYFVYCSFNKKFIFNNFLIDFIFALKFICM